MEVEEQLADVIQLDAFRRERKDRREIVVALDDALYAFLPHDRRSVRLQGGRRLRYVRRSGIETAVDLEIGAYVPTAPGCRFFFQTLEHLYEIDGAGRVYRDRDILWSEGLYSYGAPRSWLPGELRPGEEAGLLFVGREEDGLHFRIFVTDPVVIGTSVSLRRGPFPMRDWLAAAIYSLPRVPSGITAAADAKGAPEGVA